MPIPQMVTGGGPWNIFKVTDRHISSDGTQIRIDINGKSAGGSSGGNFKAAPQGLPGARTATLSYQMFVPADFPTTAKGGKLPGFCVGTDKKKCATGGKWQADAGSYRLMFRKGGSGFLQVVKYIYMPWEGGNEKERMKNAYDAQGGEYKAVAKPSNGSTGHYVYLERNNTKNNPLQLKVGVWNDVSMTLQLNSSPAASDGVIECTINGVTKKINNVRFTNNAAAKVSSVDFVSFAGGKGESWYLGKDSYFLFKNFRFSAA